jgi:hypothetical protein
VAALSLCLLAQHALCWSLQEFPELPYHRHHPTATGIAVAAKRRAFDQTSAKRRVQKSGKTITQGGLEPELGQCKSHVKKS